ncbi:conserved hypothetical protein [Paenibacillus curdlanolyticus YK9]|uniref:Uncharacterized protein n=1 Tax=Paenibacillus curdlanolyticus YK9 TaxID=717606 RepID=E0IB24_9BACL|nr:conserved hypothetical protein [Paenibacillus curdlanolyticus YK9]
MTKRGFLIYLSSVVSGISLFYLYRMMSFGKHAKGAAEGNVASAVAVVIIGVYIYLFAISRKSHAVDAWSSIFICLISLVATPVILNSI